MAMLKRNNHKIKGALIWNLPCGITCPGKTIDCDKFCYAKAAERTWSANVQGSRFRNYVSSLKNDFVQNIIADIKKSKLKFIRIHESGDMYSQEYLNKWIRIIRACPDRRFYAYTKSYQLDFSEAMKLRNFAIRYSIDLSTEKFIDGMPVAVTSKEKPKGAVQCAASFNLKVMSHKCIQDCTFCTQKKGNVWFPPHGTNGRHVR
jgi:hypothetical protein